MLPTSTTGVQAKVVSRSPAPTSPLPFCVMLACGADTGEHVDVTGNIVSAVAHCLWQARGGDSLTNWTDAEAVVSQLMGGSVAATPEKPRVTAKLALTTPPRATAPIAEPKPKPRSTAASGKRSSRR